jgi:RNA polymerase sigma-B factor
MSAETDVSRRSAKEIGQLFATYRTGGDPGARDALVEEFLPLARHLARRYGREHAQAEDLFQVASLGLLKAIDRFDPALGNAFSSFATPTILGEIKRYFRDRSWTVRVPRDLQERALAVTRAADELETELGRAPTAAEVAERTATSIEDVLEARVAATARHGLSLDRPARDEDDPGATIGARLGVHDPELARAEDAATLQRLLAPLDERERTILRLRFHEDLTQAEIAEQLGISQMHVSRLIRRSIDRMRVLAEDHPR